MKAPKAEQIQMPYASNVASFFSDQGAMQRSSFLGRLFKGGGRTTMTQTQPGGKGAGVPGSQTATGIAQPKMPVMATIPKNRGATAK